MTVDETRIIRKIYINNRLYALENRETTIRVELNSNEYRIFSALLKESPNPLSYEELANLCWGFNHDKDPENIKTSVTHLRKKMCDVLNGFEKCLKTRHGFKQYYLSFVDLADAEDAKDKALDKPIDEGFKTSEVIDIANKSSNASSINSSINDIEKHLNDVLKCFVSSDTVSDIDENERKIKNFIRKYFDFVRRRLRATIGGKDFDIDWLKDEIEKHRQWLSDSIDIYKEQLPLVDDIDMVKFRQINAMSEFEVVVQACLVEISLLEESLKYDASAIRKSRRIEELQRNKQEAYHEMAIIETQNYSMEETLARTKSSDIGGK